MESPGRQRDRRLTQSGWEGAASLVPSRGFQMTELCLPSRPALVRGTAPFLTPLPWVEVGGLRPLQHKRGADGDTS